MSRTHADAAPHPDPLPPRGEREFAFIFPGQGARNVLSAFHFARTLPRGDLVDLALSAANLTSAELTAHAGRALERTEVLQPVLAAISLAIHAELSQLQPALLFGHSLGELPALAAAGALAAEDAVKLAAVRGALMAREAATHPGGLIALTSEAHAKQALTDFPALRLAARNAPDELVLSGPTADLARVKHGQRVPVSGPWHHDALAAAAVDFRAALGALPRRETRAPVLRNADGQPGLTLDALPAQLTGPVDFAACLATARARGIDTFVTVGPGLVLRGLVRKNLGAGVRVLTTEDAADLARTKAAIEGEARSKAAAPPPAP